MERQYYLWTVGGSTVSVALARDVIEQLRQVASGTAQGEVGGVLLGRRESEERIAIEGFELIDSEHRRGVIFTLSQSDRRKLLQRMRGTSHGLEPLGSFRTHLRQGLYMDQYDYDLMSSQFASPTDVMLLIRPGDWHAGFFVWEEGDIQRQKSYREFVFDPDALPLTVITTSGAIRNPAVVAEAAQPHQANATQPAVFRKRASIPWFPYPSIPTLVKVGVTAATFGLVGMLAFYAHEHRSLAQPTLTVSAAAKSTASAIPSADIHAPVNPDNSQASNQPTGESTEMHVRIPDPATRPSPFTQVSHKTQQPANVAAKVAPESYANELQQPAAPVPIPPPPVQTAMNLPPAINVPLALKPATPPIVSTVSVEPASPGMISRSINHIPVLNLLQKHRYRAGDNFLPAKPLRQVRPRLPADMQTDSSYPLPVDVKVWIDKNGQVTKAELLSDNAGPEVADIASNAALKWTFSPAKLEDHPVDSQMVMHFRFVPKTY